MGGSIKINRLQRKGARSENDLAPFYAPLIRLFRQLHPSILRDRASINTIIGLIDEGRARTAVLRIYARLVNYIYFDSGRHMQPVGG